MEHYKSDQKLKHFLHIIEGSVVFPVIYDANRTVLSLPPIINGAHSAISLDTTDVFIECTATDLNKAKIVLNTVVTMFSEYSAAKFAVEPVDVVDSSGAERAYPDFMTRFVDVDPEYVRRRIGVTEADIDTKAMAALLCRMQLPTKIDAGTLRVEVPPTRSDILHPCDVAEDVAIAFGYNNINKEKCGPNVVTVGAQQPLNNFSDLVRQEMAAQGFSEVLTWILCSHDDNFANASRADDGKLAAIVANPSSQDVQVARSSLLQGVLKAMGANKDAPVPAKLFEVGDVVLLDDERRRRQELEAAAGALQQHDIGFEVVHGALDRVMLVTGAAKNGDAGYTLDTSMDEATYFPEGRRRSSGTDGGSASWAWCTRRCSESSTSSTRARCWSWTWSRSWTSTCEGWSGSACVGKRGVGLGAFGMRSRNVLAIPLNAFRRPRVTHPTRKECEDAVFALTSSTGGGGARANVALMRRGLHVLRLELLGNLLVARVSILAHRVTVVVRRRDAFEVHLPQRLGGSCAEGGQSGSPYPPPHPSGRLALPVRAVRHVPPIVAVRLLEELLLDGRELGLLSLLEPRTRRAAAAEDSGNLGTPLDGAVVRELAAPDPVLLVQHRARAVVGEQPFHEHVGRLGVRHRSLAGAVRLQILRRVLIRRRGSHPWTIRPDSYWIANPHWSLGIHVDSVNTPCSPPCVCFTGAMRILVLPFGTTDA